jgi:hypothetical protein
MVACGSQVDLLMLFDSDERIDERHRGQQKDS